MTQRNLSDFWRFDKSDDLVMEMVSVLQGADNLIGLMSGDMQREKLMEKRMRVRWCPGDVSAVSPEREVVFLNYRHLRGVPTPFPGEAVDKVIGDAAHEGGHVLWTGNTPDWAAELHRRYMMRGKNGGRGKFAIWYGRNRQGMVAWFKDCANILEDAYVDKKVSNRWPVLGAYIQQAKANNPADLRVDWDAIAAKPKPSMLEMRNLWCHLALYGGDVPAQLSRSVRDGLDFLLDSTLRVLKLESVGLRLDVAFECLVYMVKAYTEDERALPKKPPAPQAPAAELAEGEGEGGQGDPTPGETGLPDLEKKPKATPKGEKEDEGEKQDGEDADGDSDADAADGAGDKEAGQAPATDAEPDEEDENADPEAGQDGEGKGGDADGAGENGEDSAEAGSGSADADGEGKAGKKDTGGEAGEGGGKGGEEGDGEDGGEEADVTPSLKLAPKQPDEDKDEYTPGGTNAASDTLEHQRDMQSQVITVDDPHLLELVEKAMAEQLELLTKEVADILAQKPEEVATRARRASYDAQALAEIRLRIGQQAANLRRVFEQEMRANSRFLRGQLRGRLDTRRLARVGAGDYNVRMRREVIGKPDLALGLLMDVSGSMMGYMPVVWETAGLFAEALVGRPGINFLGCTYTTEYSNGQNGTCLTRIADRGLGRLCVGDVVQGGGTPSGQAIAAMRVLVGRMPEREKVIIHFTDGQPDREEPVRRAVEACRQAGIGVVCITVLDGGWRGATWQQQHLDLQYGRGNWGLIGKVEDLPKAVAALLKSLA